MAYSNKVLDHYNNPRNVGSLDKSREDVGTGVVGAPECGDVMKLQIQIDENERIVDAKFKTFGCGSAIASSSVLTEMIKGLTLDEAAKITNEDIANELDGLPREKMHCSVMGREALEAAMIDHYKRLGRGVPCHLIQQETILCHCFQVTKDTVRDAIFNHRLEDIEDVTNFTKAGGGCSACHEGIEEILTRVLAEKGMTFDPDAAPPPEMDTMPATLAKGATGMTNLQRIKRIEDGSV